VYRVGCACTSSPTIRHLGEKASEQEEAINSRLTAAVLATAMMMTPGAVDAAPY
jgi:hypothetical protein